MAILRKTFTGDFNTLEGKVKNAVLNGSATASLEHSVGYVTPTGRCSVMVFERYSYWGNNRVSMSVTLFQSGEKIELCAITSGGSQAMFWKVNTLGEEAFLETLERAL